MSLSCRTSLAILKSKRTYSFYVKMLLVGLCVVVFDSCKSIPQPPNPTVAVLNELKSLENGEPVDHVLSMLDRHNVEYSISKDPYQILGIVRDIDGTIWVQRSVQFSLDFDTKGSLIEKNFWDVLTGM